MTIRAVEQVENWNAHPYSGGYRGLHDLADDDFSGIVAAGPTRLCMTSGRVIGILDGTIEDFEGASGTAYEAPTAALPLLSVMQERSDEVRAQYYTEETSIDEVDRTLTQGNFTGYVVLSENVLSGDYYLVYHQGRSMSVAWVGASENRLTDDEAFDRADDEVGIYEVRPVDIEVVDIPAPAESAADETTPGAGAATTATTDTEVFDLSTADDTEPATVDDERSGADTESASDSREAETGGQTVDGSDPTPVEPETGAETNAAGGAASGSEPVPESAETQEQSGNGAVGGDTTETEAGTRDEDAGSTEQTRSESERREVGASQSDSERGGSAGTERQQDQVDRETASRRSETRSDRQRSSAQEPAAREAGTQRETGSRSADGTGGTAGTNEPQSGAAGSTHGRQTEQSGADDAGELETRSIPSLDPGRTSESDDQSGQAGPTADGDPTTSGSGTRSDREAGPAEGSEGESRHGRGPTGQGDDPAPRQDTSRQEPERSQPERPSTAGEQGEPRQEPAGPEPEREPQERPGTGEIDELEAELESREAAVADLEARLETVESERDSIAAERDELAAERDELRERVEQLEQRIDDLRTDEGGESVAGRERLSPAEAIEGTNLFVRYASKGDATLEEGHAGTAEAGAVNDNMRIQYHTQFEAEDAAVNGGPFGTYLTETIQYSFVEWIVRVLPYEIRDTGHQEALGPLYDALPRIDRAELNGAVGVQYQEDGEEHRSQEGFDVVLRDRMGNPLIVANMNESRQPASRSMMEGLIAASQRVGESKKSLAGAFLVTSSFFEPEAMEAASGATGSGLLSRDKRESFVKLSRKDGFHLCLVEAREENFNLSVPEI